jgi:hypothetical protein
MMKAMLSSLNKLYVNYNGRPETRTAVGENIAYDSADSGLWVREIKHDSG